MHRIRSGNHRIAVTAPSQPARAGIDPRSLLIDTERDDNLKEITRSRDLRAR
jgi:ABC-2 type transport system permease protein